MSIFIKICAGFLLALFFLWLAGYAVFTTTILLMKPPAHDLETDAIIVLTGGANRINTGFELLEHGLAEHLLISGVNREVTLEDLMNLWKPDQAYNTGLTCCITLGYEADDTHGNAHESRSWLEEHNVTSIRLVTSNYHVLRSLIEFRAALPGKLIIVHPVLSDNVRPFSPPFWRITWREYHKTLGALLLRYAT